MLHMYRWALLQGYRKTKSDGTDYCTVRDETDLREAVEFFAGDASSDKAVRLFVSPDSQKHQTVFGEVPDDSDAYNIVETDTETEEATVGSTEVATRENTTEQPNATSSDTVNANEEVSELEQSLRADLHVETQEEVTTAVNTPTTPAVTHNVFGNAPPQPAYQMPTYIPYAGLYPYGHCYPGNSLYPTPLPRWPISPSPLQTLQQNMHHSMDASAPPVTDATLASSKPKSKESTHASTAKSPTATTASKEHGAKAQKRGCVREETTSAFKPKTKSKYVGVALQILREMGFQQEEKELKKIIKNCNGNLNDIMDRLQRFHKSQWRQN
ncbi:unnamed protein product [Dicrocoelium dendriticum]|nr:unnamed protein product [Dicrocoelium dendriticum]